MTQRLKQAVSMLILVGTSLIAPIVEAQTSLPAYNIRKYEQAIQANRATAWRACSNYMKAGYAGGRLIKAAINGIDGSVGCDTTSVSFAIRRDQVMYWSARN
jgi:hypothetical protein